MNNEHSRKDNWTSTFFFRAEYQTFMIYLFYFSSIVTYLNLPHMVNGRIETVNAKRISLEPILVKRHVSAVLPFQISAFNCLVWKIPITVIVIRKIRCLDKIPDILPTW